MRRPRPQVAHALSPPTGHPRPLPLFLPREEKDRGNVMAIVADFMLVWLPAPTVSLRPPLQFNAGPIAKFFYSCPDNAFQVNVAFVLD
ncbi:hypothetical protein GW17_00003192 [Ensete ventricosum]|nr:hypothetical protein GW17_00003192 [Ensete ventricosum]